MLVLSYDTYNWLDDDKVLQEEYFPTYVPIWALK